MGNLIVFGFTVDDPAALCLISSGVFGEYKSYAAGTTASASRPPSLNGGVCGEYNGGDHGGVCGEYNGNGT